MTPSLDQLDVFHGDLTVNRAVVYARLPRDAAAEGLSLAGFVRGPRCERAQTLPLSTPLTDLGPGPTLLATGVVPDPCFWSPDLPAIYDVTVNLLQGTEVVASARREIGLRALGVRGRNLVLEGKRIVLRGVLSSSTTSRSPREWQGVQAQYFAAAPSDEQLAEASAWGALAAVDVGPPAVNGLAQARSASEAMRLDPPVHLASVADRLRTIARFPAVAIAVIAGTLADDFRPAQIAPNLLLAQRVEPAEDLQRQAWANLAIVRASDEQLVRTVNTWNLPVVVARALPAPMPIAEARAACDALQRDLAPLGQFAGYVV